LLNDDVLGWDDGSEILLDEFFLGHGRELVNTLLVGLVFIEVVGSDRGEVLEEYSFSVCLFELTGKVHVEFGLPGSEF